jgi:hypothetical protein
MSDYLILWADSNDYSYLKKIVADNGFPIEVEYFVSQDEVRVSTWIKDYNSSDFLHAYWNETEVKSKSQVAARGYIELKQDLQSIYGVKEGEHFFNTMLNNNLILFERVCVASRTKWLAACFDCEDTLTVYSQADGKKIEVSPYHLLAKGNWDKLPEMAAIKCVMNAGRSPKSTPTI